MTGPQDMQELASEYVLGTLPAAERAVVEARLPHDAALRTAVDQWEERLHPITALVEPLEPSPRLWPRIQRSLDEQRAAVAKPPQPTGWQRWRDSLVFWRGLSAAGFAAALAVSAVLVLRVMEPVPPPAFMVVLVAPAANQPDWVIQASDDRHVQLIPLGVMQVPADRALEFWTKADGWNKPVSLGLVQPGKPIRVPLDSLPPLQANQLFELTLEPATGSPTGLPTGPVQAIGRAVKVL
jgi:anti-sigma-K factor RskA